MSKERFKCYYCDGIENILVEDTINNETYIEDNIVNLLNQQDKENQQLKQQLHDLPKKIVEEIKDKIPEIGGMKCEIIIDDSLTLNTLLDTILKKYGGEENDRI